MRALLYVDVETTGTDPVKHDIIQLAAIAVVDGVTHTFNEYCKPINFATIDKEALAVNGISEERLPTFQDASVMVERFVRFVKATGVGRFVIAGYNVNFDKSFLASTFHKIGHDDTYRSIFTPDIHDVMKRAKAVKDQLGIKSFKLSNVAAAVGVPLTNAHDALADIKATMEVDEYLAKMLDDAGITTTHEDVEHFSIPEIPHLHLHSEYSFRSSCVSIEDWMKWAAANKVPAVSFPDHDIAASIFRCLKEDKKTKTYSADHGDVVAVPATSFILDVNGDRSHLPRLNAWATSNDGYKSIIKLASTGWDKCVSIDDKASYPVVSVEELECLGGLVIGSGDDAGVFVRDNQPLLMDEAVSAISKIKLHPSSSFVMELLAYDKHAIFDSNAGFKGVAKTDKTPDGNLTAAINLLISRVNEETGIPFIISTAAHFITPEDKLIQDVVSRSAHKDGRYFYESRHQPSSSICFSILNRHLPHWMTLDVFQRAVSTANHIVDMAKTIVVKPTYHLPHIEIPEDIKEKTDDYNLQLYYLTMARIYEHGRWNNDPIYVARFKKELDVIWKNKTLNFLPYFLMYEDIGRFARENGILQNLGRGSAGGSLLSYYLKIIHVDPIKENMPFERFLSHARINAGSFPDIDADFGDRKPILEYLKKKYGVGFAQIGTILTFKTKNAIKDAMHAIYGRNRADKEILDVCDTIPDSPQGIDEEQFLYGYTDSEGEYHKGHLEENVMLQGFFAQYPDAEAVIKRLIGLPKATGRHASGFVISTLDLAGERVPTMLIDDDTESMMPVTQYEASYVEKNGLVKADILGVVTINTVSDCMRMVMEREGLNYLEEDDNGVAYIYRLPEDPKVYEDFYLRKTDSSFQFNTSLIKSMVQDFAPACRADLSHFTALARPGALDVQVEPGVSATQWYIDVRNGRREPHYVHPDLKEILEPTNGVVVYQEQLMKILVDFCGYSLEESDQIRSAIAKKKKDVMVKAFEKVREETQKRGWTLEQAEEVCGILSAYSNYSFNLSHSRAYSELGYITMYLKRNHPLEWWCAELNSCLDKSGEKAEDKIRAYANLLGDLLAPPSLANPSQRFVIDGKYIRSPLSIVKGVGPASIGEIVSHGPYANLQEFIKAVSPIKCNGGHFASLVRARVADCFMDPSLPYAEARLKLLQEYTDTRKCRPLPVDVYDTDPLSIFLNERTANKVFSRTLISVPEIRALLVSRWKILQQTGKKAVPLMMGTTPVIASMKAARAILEKQDEIEVGFIGIYEGSESAKGVSKKSGRPWKKVDVKVSDGIETMVCTIWDKDKALRVPLDSIFYVRGKLKKGWKGDPTITIEEVQRLGEEE